jgi:hypothetical protein
MVEHMQWRKVAHLIISGKQGGGENKTETKNTFQNPVPNSLLLPTSD